MVILLPGSRWLPAPGDPIGPAPEYPSDYHLCHENGLAWHPAHYVPLTGLSHAVTSTSSSIDLFADRRHHLFDFSLRSVGPGSRYAADLTIRVATICKRHKAAPY